MSETNPIPICLAYPAFNNPVFIDALAAVDPRIEVMMLPSDEGGDFMTPPASDPYPEPPPWATRFEHERAAMLARCEILIALQSPDDLMNRAPKLRWVQSVGAGVEQFAGAGVPAEGVLITNASGVSARSMAEFVIGRLLQVWKRFPEAHAHQQAHDYIRTYGRTFAGSVIGIVGMGSIGVAVAERATALGARVHGLRRSYKPGDTSEVAEALYGPDQLHEMLSHCDAVVVAAPATPETHHLIDAKAFAAMQENTMLVNVARGALVDEDALLKALDDGTIGFAALDVFEEEPLPPDNPFWDHPRVLVSAHSAVSVDRYMDDIFDLFIANVRRYVQGETLRNVIDPKGHGFGDEPGS